MAPTQCAARGQHRHHAAEAELPEPAGQEKIGGRLGDGIDDGERRQRRRAERRDHRETRRHSAGPPARAEQQQRGEDQVELFFHPERPGVAERVELRVRPEIVDRPQIQENVRQPEQRGQPRVDRAGGIRIEQPDKQAGRNHRKRQRGRQTLEPARVEIQEEVAKRQPRSIQQRKRDDEPGNDEKDIDAEIAAGQHRMFEMVRDDRNDGDCPQPIDGWKIGMAFLPDRASDRPAGLPAARRFQVCAAAVTRRPALAHALAFPNGMRRRRRPRRSASRSAGSLIRRFAPATHRGRPERAPVFSPRR